MTNKRPKGRRRRSKEFDKKPTITEEDIDIQLREEQRYFKIGDKVWCKSDWTIGEIIDFKADIKSGTVYFGEIAIVNVNGEHRECGQHWLRVASNDEIQGWEDWLCKTQDITV